MLSICHVGRRQVNKAAEHGIVRSPDTWFWDLSPSGCYRQGTRMCVVIMCEPNVYETRNVLAINGGPHVLCPTGSHRVERTWHGVGGAARLGSQNLGGQVVDPLKSSFMFLYFWYSQRSLRAELQQHRSRVA